MLAKPETRWGAFGIHLAISALIFIILASIIVFVWYPGFLFRTDGGWQGIRLIAGIDLILGPLLTLIVYNKLKPSLPFDLAVIAAVQIGALGFGSYLVYQERPIAVVYAGDKFSTMSHNSFAFYNIDPDSIELLAGKPKPVWIYADSKQPLPGESATENFTRLGPEHLRVENYRAIDDNINKLNAVGLLEVGELRLKLNEDKRYFKMLSRYYEGYLLFDLKQKKVLDTILTNSTDDYGITRN